MAENENETKIFENTCDTLEIAVKRTAKLRELADSGNIFAEYQLKYEETGLSVNPQALLRKECNHRRELANGTQISAVQSTTRRNRAGWLIQEKICALCGKTVEITVLGKKGL